MTLELFFSACLMFQLSPELACLRDLPNIGGIIIGRLRGVERESHTHHRHENFIMVVASTKEMYQWHLMILISPLVLRPE